MQGRDIVAVVAIIINGLLVYCGHDGVILNLLAIIIGWYFGSKGSQSQEAKSEQTG